VHCDAVARDAQQRRDLILHLVRRLGAHPDLAVAVSNVSRAIERLHGRVCLERGVITRALPDADTIAFSPPFVVTKDELDEMVSTARAATDDVAAELRAG